MHRLGSYLGLVRFEHTLFALPFAYGGMLLGGHGWPGIATFFWITLAMVGARTAAMAFNRLLDRQIDALNPRTKGRHLPRGRLSPAEVLFLALLALALLAVSALQLNPLTARLFPLAAVLLVFYSYTKRFTWTCHYWLGLVNGAAAAAGWIAVTGAFEPGAWALWAAVALWLAGFDILYATQDMAFDQNNGIHSIPVHFGLPSALYIARLTHAVSWIMFVLTGLLYGGGLFYYLGVVAVGLVLLLEHRLVHPDDLSKVQVAFFQANVAVSVGMLIFIALQTLT